MGEVLKSKTFLSDKGLCKFVNSNNIKIIKITEFMVYTLFYKEN